MDLLKLELTTLLALVFLNYIEQASDIILTVDTSLKGWGRVLIQLVKRKRHSLRYKSRIWSTVEKKYNVTKQKCQKV